MANDRFDTSDAGLPDDLQFLGEQLWEDAEHLARTYPANAPRSWRRAFALAVAQKADPASERTSRASAAPIRWRPVTLGGAAVAALVTFVLVGWSMIEFRDSDGAPASPVTAGLAPPAGQQSPERPIPAGVGLISSLDTSLWRQESSQPRIVVPLGAETLDFLSPTEQEAFIDALNEKQIPEPNVPY